MKVNYFGSPNRPDQIYAAAQNVWRAGNYLGQRLRTAFPSFSPYPGGARRNTPRIVRVVSSKQTKSAPSRNVDTPLPSRLRPPIRAYKKTNRATIVHTGRLGKRFPKGTKRAKNYMSKFARLGITRSFEYNGTTTTTNQCIFIGHATCPMDVVRSSIAQAIIKKLLMKADLIKPSTSLGLNLGGLTLSTFYIDNDDATPGLVSTINIGDADSVNTLAAFIVPYMGSQVDYPNRKIIALELSVTGTNQPPICRLFLANAKIVFNIQSKLKIQNRTQAAGTDANQTTTITNNPLQGKVYDGKGTGTNYMVATNALGVGGQKMFFVSKGTGVMDFAPTDNDLQEPPYGAGFDKVKGMKGYAILPGEIKTSYLGHSSKMALSSALKLLSSQPRGGTPISPTDTPQVEFGKFRFMALEKVIDPVETEPDITIGFEHQWNIGVYVVPGHESVTTNYHETSWKA